MIMSTILEIAGGSSGGGKSDSGIMEKLMDFKNKLPQDYNLLDIESRIKVLTPFVIVC